MGPGMHAWGLQEPRVPPGGSEGRRNKMSTSMRICSVVGKLCSIRSPFNIYTRSIFFLK